MKNLTVALGAFAFIFALADAIHGQHNGDIHRFYIHIAEFISFLSCLGLLVIQLFGLMTAKGGMHRWLAAVCISFMSFIIGFLLFALSGGSAHGDGGPLAVCFALIGCFGAMGIPISVIGFLVAMAVGRIKTSSLR